MNDAIRAKLDALPQSPGVYLMKDAKGRIFYVGKAKSLRSRVRSYFSGSDTRAFVPLLEHLLADLEVILTHSNKEAMLLENELIKKHQPRFNVKLTDDKRFLCLRLDTRHAYPRLDVVRRFGTDKARYFGPYHSASSIRESLRIINRHFQLRTCSDQVLENRKRPCLQYQIKRCPAPCVYDLSDGSYQANVDSVTAFLSGRHEDLQKDLESRMRAHSERMEYEQAAVLRDQLRAVQRSMERQRVITSDFVDRDVVGLHRQGPAVEIHVMRTREGRLIGAKRFSFDDLEVPTPEILADFAMRYYSEDGAEVPDEILFPSDMQWASTLGEVLTEHRGKRVQALVPQRGDKRRLVELAERNAKQAYSDKQREAGAARSAVEKLQRVLRLAHPPERIECVDISHLQGSHIVGSVVRLEQGVPRKELYRHYKVRSTDGQDDFQSMYEVLSRRARRGLEDGDLPDLIIIDGGKGQLGAARAALDDHGVDSVDLIGLAKARNAKRPATEVDESTPQSPERVFVFGHKNPIVPRQNSAELFMLTRARDEAHRFAISFHRNARRKAATRSALDDIPGVGPKRRRALLQTFGSIARIKHAPENEIAQVVGPKLARAIIQALTPATDEARSG